MNIETSGAEIGGAFGGEKDTGGEESGSVLEGTCEELPQQLIMVSFLLLRG